MSSRKYRLIVAFISDSTEDYITHAYSRDECAELVRDVTIDGIGAFEQLISRRFLSLA